MTKEEIDIQKEIEKYFTESTGFGKDKIRNFMDIVNKALKQKGERIEELENKIADIKANCDLAIEGRDIKIKELEETIANLKEQVQSQVEATIELDKENEKLKNRNAELKEQSDKWFVFETEAGNWGMDKATQYTVDRHNYFYGTENECLKWSVEHKIKDYTGHKYCYDRLDNQLTKAKEIILHLLACGHFDFKCEKVPVEKYVKQAEQFLQETDIDNAIQKANEGLNLDKIAEEVEDDLKERCPDVLCEECTKEDCISRKLGLIC